MVLVVVVVENVDAARYVISTVFLNRCLFLKQEVCGADAAYAERCAEWRRLFNGDPFQEPLTHYCTVKNGCGKDTCYKMANSVTVHMFRSRCPVPEIKEWTKFGAKQIIITMNAVAVL